MTHPPFNCNKAILFNLKKDIKDSKKIKDLFSMFTQNNYDIYNLLSFEGSQLHKQVSEYIYNTIHKPISFCSNLSISGMNTGYLFTKINRDKMLSDNLIIMICYHISNDAVPFSVLVFKYILDENNLYIVSVCADKTTKKSNGSGSLLLDDLIKVATLTIDIDSIYLHSVSSATNTYNKKGFLETGDIDDELPEMQLSIKRKINDINIKSSLIPPHSIKMWSRREGLRPSSKLSIEALLQNKYPDFVIGNITKRKKNGGKRHKLLSKKKRRRTYRKKLLKI
jgi:hypothetical protein